MATKTKKVKEALEPLAFGRDSIVKLMKDAFGSKSAAKETNEWLTTKIATLSDELDDEQLSELEEEAEDSHEVAVAIMEAVEKGQPVVVIDETEDEEADDTEVESDEDQDETEEADDEETEDEEVESDEDESDEDESDEESDDSEDDEPEPDEDEEVEVKTPAKKTAAKSAPAKKPEVKKKAAAPAAKATGKKLPPAPAKKTAAKKDGPKPGRGKGKTYYIIKLLSQATKKKPITKERILAELVKKFGKDAEAGMAVTINSQINGQLKANKQMVIGKDGNGGYWLEDIGNYVFPE